MIRNNTKENLNYWKCIAEKYVFNYMKENLDPQEYYDPVMDTFISQIMNIKNIMYDVLSQYYSTMNNGIYGGYFRDKIMYDISKSSLCMKIRLFLKLMNTKKHDIDIYSKTGYIIKKKEYDNIIDSMNELFSKNNLPLFNKDTSFFENTNTYILRYNFVCMSFKIENGGILEDVVFGIDISSWEIYRELNDISINRIYESMMVRGTCIKGKECRTNTLDIERQIKDNIIDMSDDMYYQLKVMELASKKYFYENVFGITNIVNNVTSAIHGNIHADEYCTEYTLKMYMRFYKMRNYGFNIISDDVLSIPTKHLYTNHHNCDEEEYCNCGTNDVKVCVYLNYSTCDCETRVCGECGEIYLYHIKKACRLITISQSKMLCDIAIICL